MVIGGDGYADHSQPRWGCIRDTVTSHRRCRWLVTVKPFGLEAEVLGVAGRHWQGRPSLISPIPPTASDSQALRAWGSGVRRCREGRRHRLPPATLTTTGYTGGYRQSSPSGLRQW